RPRASRSLRRSSAGFNEAVVRGRRRVHAGGASGAASGAASTKPSSEDDGEGGVGGHAERNSAASTKPSSEDDGEPVVPGTGICTIPALQRSRRPRTTERAPSSGSRGARPTRFNE